MSNPGDPVFSSGGVSPLPPFDFGSVASGQSGLVLMTFANDGNGLHATLSSVVVTGVGFSTDAVTPRSVPADGEYNFNLIFAPTTNGAFNGTVTITWTDSSGTHSVSGNLTGQGFSFPTGAILQFSPVVLSFPDTQVLTSSDPLGVMILNVGTGDLTISSISLGAGTDFSISALPTPLVRNLFIPLKRRKVSSALYYPYMSSVSPHLIRGNFKRKSPPRLLVIPVRKSSFPIVVTAGGSILIEVIFSPTIPGFLTDVLNVQTNLGSNPSQLGVQGESVLLVPVQAVSNSTRAVIVGYQDGNNIVTHRQYSPSDYNCDQASSFTPNGAMWQLKEEKTLTRLELWYENLGAVSFTVTFKAWRPTVGADSYDSKTTSTQTIGTATADKTERSIIVDVPSGGVTGEIVEFTLNRAALAGPLVITQFKPYFTKRGEKVEGT